MIKEIRVKEGSDTGDMLFFREADLSSFDNRVIPLFGPNGIGKSTLIRAAVERNPDIEFVADGKRNYIYAYENGRDNFKNREPRNYMESFDPSFINSKYDARQISEGQSIIYSMYDLLDGLKPDKKNPQGVLYEKDGDIIVLLDEIDSGMSIDNIDVTMRKIKSIARKRDDIQFILSFNSPRVLKHFPYVLSMYDGKRKEMHTDDDMLEEIRAHKDVFAKARKKANGRPKIYY